MIDDMIRCMCNPACSRVMMTVAQRGRATAGELAQALPDIAQASLYRYLKQLKRAGAVEVVEERRVRGAVERVYALDQGMGEEGVQLLKEKPGETYLKMYAQFSAQLMAAFTTYCRRPDIDIEKDGTGFSVCPVYVTIEELTQGMIKIGEILQEMAQNGPGPGRALHAFATIVTPPSKEE